MTTLALTRRHAREDQGIGQLFAMLAATPSRIARWRTIRSDRRLLQSMPDSLLSDIGISRGAIDHATAFGRSVD